MRTITERFLAYKAKPKQPEVPAQPKEPEVYPHEGFLSPTETVVDRMGRLSEAMAKGLRLMPLEFHWFRSHQRFFGELGSIFKGKTAQTLRNRQLQRADFQWRRIVNETKMPYNGGRF